MESKYFWSFEHPGYQEVLGPAKLQSIWAEVVDGRANRSRGYCYACNVAQPLRKQACKGQRNANLPCGVADVRVVVGYGYEEST